jgi:hypothetical protein
MPETGLETPIQLGPWPDKAAACLFLSQMVGNNKATEKLPDLIQLTDWLNQIELAAFAYTYFKNWNDPDSTMATKHLESSYWTGLAAASIKLTALRPLLKRFAAEGIDCTLIKGIAFGFTIYTEHAVRSMNDIDLWIQKSDLPVVQRLMYEMGYQDGEWLDSQNVPDYVTELSFFPEEPQISKWNIDIHWDLLSKPGLIGCLPIEDWWRRRRSVEFNGLKVMVLDPADALVHACVHQWLEHRSDLRFRWLLDVDRLLRMGEPYSITPAHWPRLGAEYHDSVFLPVIQAGIQQAVQWFTTPLSDQANKLVSQPLDFEQKIFYLSYAVSKMTARKMLMTSFYRVNRYRYLAHFVWRSFFPSSKYMMQQYRISRRMLLPLCYGKRILQGIKIFIKGV